MYPLILKGHSRSLTLIKYNHDGDLLFSSSKDSTPTVWYTESGERVGTYDGHRGTVWALDINRDSTKLVTAGADMTVKLWWVKSGEMIMDFPHPGPVRVVEFSEGDKMVVTLADPFQSNPSTVAIYDVADAGEEQPQEPRIIWDSTGVQEGKKLTKLTWTPLNEHILSGDEMGVMRLHEVETGRVVRTMKEHTKRISSFKWNKEKTLLITGSADCTAKLWDAREWVVLQTYTTSAPVNCAAISPIKEHVLVAGGQEAMNVTTTSAAAGKFETKFFHMVFGDEFGSVKGHFGPVNTIDIHPEGIGFATGSEDGYIRLHNFDKDYFGMHSVYDDLESLQMETAAAAPKAPAV